MPLYPPAVIGATLAEVDTPALILDLDAFEVIDCDTLAKVQLGSGLIVLNSVLDARGSRR